MKENWPWDSNVRITVRDLGGNILDVQEIRNLIMHVGSDMLRDILMASIASGQIKYVGIGTGDTAPNKAQTQLVSEQFRKILTGQVAVTTGTLKTTHYIAPSEAVVNIKEIGWFAGVGATATPNSGVMVSRILYTRNKTNLESITIERTDVIAEG